MADQSVELRLRNRKTQNVGYLAVEFTEESLLDNNDGYHAIDLTDNRHRDAYVNAKFKEYIATVQGIFYVPNDCRLFEANERGDRCKVCNDLEMFHKSVSSSESDFVSTDAFGTIEFQDSRRKTRAQYIRLSEHTNMGSLFKMIRTDWKLKRTPKLLISITGSCQQFSLSKKLRPSLQQLLKASLSTNAWFITNGLKDSVMEVIDDCLIQDIHRKITVIGIVPWGVVYGREGLRVLKQKKPENKPVIYPPTNVNVKEEFLSSPKHTVLNSNHTHFILVDNGKVDMFGGEALFRTKFEQFITNDQLYETAVPAIRLIINGGPETLFELRQSLFLDKTARIMPVVVMEGSGHAADLLAHAHKMVRLGSLVHSQAGVVDETKLISMINSKFPHLSPMEALKTFHDIIICMQKKEYITIYSPDGPMTLDETILMVLIDSEKKAKSQLDLAMLWDRPDIANKDVSIEKAITNNNMDFQETMWRALIQDKYHFIDLLLDSGFNINLFLDYGVLGDLYYYIYDKPGSIFRLIIAIFYSKNVNLVPHPKHISLYVVQRILSQLTNIKMAKHYWKPGYTAEQRFEQPFTELFLWAVLHNKFDMAVCLWRRGEQSLSKALIARKLYLAMSKIYKTYNHKMEEAVYEKLRESAETFGGYALEILKSCSNYDEHSAELLLSLPMKNFGSHNCMSIAQLSNLEEFIEHSSCQNVISEHWNGGIHFRGDTIHYQILMAILFPPLFWVYKYCKYSNRYQHLRPHQSSKMLLLSDETTNNRENSLSKIFFALYNAPVTCFWLNFISFPIFLVLLSSVVLLPFEKRISVVEWIVFAIVVSLTTEEIRQICYSKFSVSLCKKIINWWSVNSNKCDCVAILLYFVGFALRICSCKLNHVAHTVLTVDVMLWVMRLLEVFALSKRVGPMVVMIQRMVSDVAMFLSIFSVFMLAFSIGRYSLLVPYKRFTLGDLAVPYLHLYGEIFMENSKDRNTTLFETGRLDNYTEPLVFFLMAVYLIFTSLLLVNLLIACFNNTYNELRINSKRIWKFQRYLLVQEYSHRPLPPPPFIIISHLYLLVKFFITALFTKDDESDDETPEKSALLYELMKLEQQGLNRFLSSTEKKDIDYNLQEDKLKDSRETYQHIYKGMQKEFLELNTKLSESIKSTEIRLNRIERAIQTQKRIGPSTPMTMLPSPTGNDPIFKRGMQAKNETVSKKIGASVSLDEKILIGSSHEKQEDSRSPVKKKKTHLLARCSNYPFSGVQRLFLPDHFVDWELEFKDYTPKEYTSPTVLAGLAWADKELDPDNPYKFNVVDGKLNRKSFEGLYQVIDGLPRNPIGRTGLAGRGFLGRYGPNHIAEPLFTRFINSTVKQVSHKLEVLVIESTPGEYSLPSGEVESDEKLPKFLVEFLSSETLAKIGMNTNQQRLPTKVALQALLRHNESMKVFEGYLDDERNTDNAWLETSVYNYHDSGGVLKKFMLDTEAVSKLHLKWVEVSEDTPLRSSQQWYLKFVANLRNAYFSDFDGE